MSRGTPIRGFRVEDDLFAAATKRAEAEGVSVSDVVRSALKVYADGAACRWVRRPKRQKGRKP